MSPKGGKWSLFFLVQPRLCHSSQAGALATHPYTQPGPVGVLLGSHLCVGLGHLLIQRLVVVNRQLQVLHLRRQATFAAHLAPGIHSRQELEGDAS